MFLKQLLMEEETQSSHQCAEHKGVENSVYHHQSLQKSTAMKWQQFPCFGKVGENSGITKGFLKTGIISSRIIFSVVPSGWRCLQTLPHQPRAFPVQGGDREPFPLAVPPNICPELRHFHQGTLQGPLSAAEVLWTLLLGVVFPARLNPFIAKWALQKCLELGHSTEEKYFNLQRAPPLSLFIFFSLPGVADSSQILVDSKEIQKTKKQFITYCNNWNLRFSFLINYLGASTDCEYRSLQQGFRNATIPKKGQCAARASQRSPEGHLIHSGLKAYYLKGLIHIQQMHAGIYHSLPRF